MQFQSEAKFQTFLVIICMRLKEYFHVNGSALSLSLKQRLEATRKWPFYWQITVTGVWQIQNKIDLSEVCEPARLSNPHKQLFSLKPLETKPPLGQCYIVTTFSMTSAERVPHLYQNA